MVMAFLLPQLEKALNRYLALDPESYKRLNNLDGKTITICLKPLDLTFQIRAFEQKLHLSAEETHPTDIKIIGTPLSLLSLALTTDKKHRFFGDDITIEGDTEYGQQVIDLFDQLEFDWEEYLSQVIGDTPAHEVGRFAKGFFRWSKRAKETLLKNIDEYVHEEQPLFPPEEELQGFYNEVDDVRMETDRLEARIKNLD
ncbi:MAG TPA: SCP2 sterol-binding domain-containing protein [Gammaproteobacteria bacterium]|nr:SCP2 sterol-binding domain-containing protein [Gammaproteobacteria bacterium]